MSSRDILSLYPAKAVDVSPKSSSPLIAFEAILLFSYFLDGVDYYGDAC
jgi:hypothetical protein